MEPGPSFSLPNAVFSPLGMPLLPTPFTLLSWEKNPPHSECSCLPWKAQGAGLCCVDSTPPSLQASATTVALLKGAASLLIPLSPDLLFLPSTSTFN